MDLMRRQEEIVGYLKEKHPALVRDAVSIRAVQDRIAGRYKEALQRQEERSKKPNTRL
jgi:hypothetical protein